MTLEEIKTLLSGITGYTGKVAYYAWPVSEAPSLPFICFYETGSNNFTADGKVFHKVKTVDVELYTETKSTNDEALVETALANAGIVWKKQCYYIDDEKCWQIIYSIEV